MADLVSYGNAERDIEQALIALKKGAQLLKYGRKGKPKFYPFRLSNDETSLIWISSSGERSLKLASVSRIFPGQRTAVFQRYLRPDKEYLSFSLIYNNGKRSLDLICKDKVEAEIWIAGLKALISSGQAGRAKIDGWGDGGLYFDDNKDLTSNSPSSSSVSATREASSPEGMCTYGVKLYVIMLSRLVQRRMLVPLAQELMFFFPGHWNAILFLMCIIACGVRHAALVTRQGEVFSWGEESGGRLGHGVGKDVTQPRLVESLTFCSVDFVACGEFHTCAVTMAGELYTWGDGTHNAGLLGHGSDVSHWIPKRISGPLEGLQVAMVTCGPWHTALIRQLDSCLLLEMELLVFWAMGIGKTSCIQGRSSHCQSSASFSSGKLFTWGDGDKNRLGHGDKEPRLKPTCVPALIDYNFHKIACGHSLTVGLTTSGRVFTMGSTVYGQLGNPQSDGKLPCLVEDKLAAESVEEIACGAYHVAVLTSKNEVYTWGKGANGRLGHGDIEDRKTPTLVEALKDRHVKFIACGSNYTSAICLHKWVSGAEQSQCSACRQAFGFTRKRHNCYNCGLVHCHACSSRKAPRAALAPNPSKPYRVCDSCFAKLSKVAEAGANNRRNSGPRLSGENKDRLDKADLRLARSALPANFDLIKQLDIKAAKQGKKADTFSLGRSSQVSLLQLRETVMSTAVDVRRNVPKPILTPSSVSSRSVSPFSRKPSPPRSATPVPTTSGLSFSKSITDSLKKTNELLNQEVHKLRLQVESLKNRCEMQELELQQSAKKAQEAMTLAAEESAKCKAAKEVIKSLTAQLKDMAEKLPPGAYDPESLKLVYLPNGLEPIGSHHPGAGGERSSGSDAIDSSYLASHAGTDSAMPNRTSGSSELLGDASGSNGSSLGAQALGLATSNGTNDRFDARLPNGGGNNQSYRSSVSESLDGRESGPYQDSETGLKSRNSVVPGNASQIEAEWIEQYEPGVYITLVALRDGTRDLKRVRFSRRRFGEHQAETWWSENREKVYEKYNVRGSDKSSVSGQAARRSEGALSPSSQI
ncbi:UNVERIFIED_CONTAM: PH, RCC1 and FYVE domains-containing protein 1 [Sesamum latifolium]|uniref:PH, RCC1 and FYVE domains-containing protein 1 n=1 Tax=Sesamum latifolium TaxID=2727402 RepID=A0AAW2WBW8_9LAMI